MPTVPGRRKGRLHERGKLITGPPSTPPVPNLIDLHVLMLPSDGAEPRIIQQLKREPVNLVVCPGVPGHIGQARAMAFEQGTAPWVAWADPDDLIEPGIFQSLLAAAHSSPQAHLVFAHEWAIDTSSGKRERVCVPHHALIARRNVVMERLEVIRQRPHYCEGPIHAIEPRLEVPEIGYHWLRAPKSASQALVRRPVRAPNTQ